MLLWPASVGAHPGGGPPGGTPGGPPVGTPGGPPPGVPISNSNGALPIGKATSAPDTDRGHSEGKGRTDVAPGKPTIGRVATFSGTTLTLTLPTGVSKTFTVDAHAFGQLNVHKGAELAVTSSDGVYATSVTPAEQTIRGTVESVSANTSQVTLSLPNGKTLTIMVAPEAAAHMALSKGIPLTLASHDGGFSADPVVVGKVTSFSGTTLTLTLPTGIVKTFTVDAHVFGQLKPALGSSVAVETANGSRALSVTPAEQTIRGIVESVSANTSQVTLTLPNGNLMMVMVAPEAAARIPLAPGTQLVLTSHDGGVSFTPGRP